MTLKPNMPDPTPRRAVRRATRTADGASLTASVRNAPALPDYRTQERLSKNARGSRQLRRGDVKTPHLSEIPSSVRGIGVFDVHRRQVLHLLLADAQPDAVTGAGHRADRDGYFLAAPQVALLQEHVSHVAAAAGDDQALDPADVAVGGLDLVAARHVRLTLRDGVSGDGLRDGPAAKAGQAAVQATHAGANTQAVVGPVAHLARAVARVAAGSRYEPGLLGGIELLELRLGAAEPDLVSRRVDEAERDEPAEAAPVFRLDHQMGDRLSDRVDDHAGHLAAGPVAAASLGPDRELHCFCHGLPRFSSSRRDQGILVA